jgi:hypothetical protein
MFNGGLCLGYTADSKVGYFRLWRDIGDITELPLGCVAQITLAKFDTFGFTALPADDPTPTEIHTHIADDIDIRPFLNLINHILTETEAIVKTEGIMLDPKRKT